MRIYFKILGGHVHCRVFTSGSKCGDLTFSVEEWLTVRSRYFTAEVQFFQEH